MGKTTGYQYKSAAVDLSKIYQSSKFDSGKSNELTSLNKLQTVLRNPQEFENIRQLYEYCDYYINYDSICSGAVKNIFIPFSQAPYRLVGGNQKSRTFFEQLFVKNNIEDIIRGCANDYHKYGNIFVYLDNDYTIQMLPPHRCFIENISIGGEPIVSFEIDRVQKVGKVDIKDLERKYKGYPEEILKEAKKGSQYARLSADRLFSCSYTKASWEKYAIPPLTSALSWLVKKETLNNTLVSELDNMKRTFLHVKVGDKDKNPIPALEEISDVGSVFLSSMKTDGGMVAPTSWNVDAEFKNGGTKDSLTIINDMMTNINWNILSALSLSSVLATGENLPNTSSSVNFSTMQATVSLVNKRINAFLNDVSKMFNKIIVAISAQEGFKSYPTLRFELVDLNNKDGINELIFSLYDKGFLSKRTVYEHTNFDFDEEVEKRKTEKEKGYEEILTPPQQPYNMTGTDSDKKAGRPELDMDERKSEIDGKNENPRPSRE